MGLSGNVLHQFTHRCHADLYLYVVEWAHLFDKMFGRKAALAFNSGSRMESVMSCKSGIGPEIVMGLIFGNSQLMGPDDFYL